MTQPGDRFRSRNTMFWRADPNVKRDSARPGWLAFLRACSRCGLHFDDIDPVRDNPRKDVPATVTGGYQAVAFRADKDPRGFYIQRFVACGTGAGPREAVLDAYRQAIAAGDRVEPGLEPLMDGVIRPLPAPDLGEIAALIGEAETAVCIDVEGLIG